MTSAQKQQLDRIVDIMREHFETGIVVVECDDTESPSGDAELHVAWHGGFANGYGLLGLGKFQMMNERDQNYGREP